MSSNHISQQNDVETNQKLWQEQIREEDKKLILTHSKREFTFNQTEARQLLKAATMQGLASELYKIAQSLIDDIINNNALPRISILPTAEKKILFEPTLGRFCIWEPRASGPTPTTPKPKRKES